MDKTFWLGDKKFDKFELLAVFWSFCNQTFKFNMVWDFFKSTGLIIQNSNMIFDKICKNRLKDNKKRFQLYIPNFSNWIKTLHKDLFLL